MNAKLTILITLLAAGCSSAGAGSAGEDLLDGYEAAVTQVRELTDAYVADAEASVELTDIGALQADYQAAMEDAMGEIEHTLEELGGCEMMGDGMDRVDEAMSSVDSVRAAMEDLIAGHADHSDVADCYAAAADYELSVDAEVEAMEGHHDAWHDEGMSCGQGHDEG